MNPPQAEANKKKVKEVLTPLKVSRRDQDWCRACVMGPRGYASCQKVYATSKDEGRESIKARAREKACVDSGFTKDKCPDSSVVMISCKDDPPPKDPKAAGRAMLRAFSGKQPQPAEKSTETTAIEKQEKTTADDHKDGDSNKASPARENDDDKSAKGKGTAPVI